MCWRLPLLFLKMIFLVTVGFILRSQSKSWLSGCGTQLPPGCVWCAPHLQLTKYLKNLHCPIPLWQDWEITHERSLVVPLPCVATSNSYVWICAPILSTSQTWELLFLKSNQRWDLMQTFGNPFRNGPWELSCCRLQVSEDFLCYGICLSLCSDCAVIWMWQAGQRVRKLDTFSQDQLVRL